MIVTTRAQREALFRLFQRDFPTWITPYRRHEHKPCNHCGQGGGAEVKVPSIQYRRFRETVRGGSGCIMIQRWGIWLGIEPDGYTHS